MTRNMVNRLSAIGGLLIPLVAFSLVLTVVTTGWERGLPDEGSAAHLFQLLVVLEIPVVALYVATAERRWSRTALGMAALQCAFLMVALASVRFFHL